MPGDKYLTHNAGVQTEKYSTQISAGSASAGDIVALNASGLLDPTLFPPSSSQPYISHYTGYALSACQLVAMDSGGTLRIAGYALGSAYEATGFVQTAYSAGSTAAVYLSGAIMTGLTGLIPGRVCFLGPDNLGSITQTPTVSRGALIQRVGFALSATSLLFIYSPSVAA